MPATVLAFLLLLSLSLPARSAEVPRVVATIAPLHSLVAGVMEGVGEPHLLVPGGASPHTYALRPSDARALAQANLLVWVGPGLEGFLAKPLAAQRPARLVTLSDLPDIVRLPARKGGAWEGHGTDADDHDHGHGAHGHDIDFHLWLDPANARVLTAAVAQALSDLDPERAEHYRANRERVLADLGTREERVRQMLAPVGNRPFVVFHDAYHYFEQRFGLRPAGSVTVDPERRPGAKRVAAIRAKLRDLGVRCVFSEPQFQASLVDVVIEDTEARHGVLDPLGVDLAPGPGLYGELLERLAQSLAGCLRE